MLDARALPLLVVMTAGVRDAQIGARSCRFGRHRGASSSTRGLSRGTTGVYSFACHSVARAGDVHVIDVVDTGSNPNQRGGRVDDPATAELMRSFEAERRGPFGGPKEKRADPGGPTPEPP